MSKKIDSLSEMQATRLSWLKKTFQMVFAMLLAKDPQKIGALVQELRGSVADITKSWK